MANPSSQFECTKGTKIGRADQFWLPLSVRPTGDSFWCYSTLFKILVLAGAQTLAVTGLSGLWLTTWEFEGRVSCKLATMVFLTHDSDCGMT